jgi:hypothetical protein
LVDVPSTSMRSRLTGSVFNVRGESSNCPQGRPYSRHLLDAGHGVYRFVEDKRTSTLAGSMSKQKPGNPLLDVGINLTRSRAIERLSGGHL